MHLLAKLTIALIEPIAIMGLLLGLGTLLLWWGRVRAARALLSLAFAFFVLVGLTPLPDVMMRSLEDRFPRPAVDLGEVAGAIVLGGGTGSARVAEERDTYLLSESAERLTAALGLRAQAPDLTIVFAGYHGTVHARGLSEGDITRRLILDLGLDPARFLFEERSRNTFENAALTYELVHPKDARPWLLVTSAFHMPRSVAVFRAVGFEVVPYPVDFRALPPAETWADPNITGRFEYFRVASRELIGLVAYRLLGRTDTLWPAP